MLEVDGKVVYVGKGHGKRMYYHRKVLDHPRNKQNERPMYVDLRKRVEAGTNLTERIVFSTSNEVTALLHESELIAKYGIENLVNVATHAFTGRHMKPAVGQLISKKLKAYVTRCRDKYGTGHPPEVAAKIAASNTGKKMSPDHREKIIAMHASGKMDTHLRKLVKIGAAAWKGSHFTDAQRKKMVDAHAARFKKYASGELPRPARVKKRRFSSPVAKTHGLQSRRGKWIGRMWIHSENRLVCTPWVETPELAAKLYDDLAELHFKERPVRT